MWRASRNIRTFFVAFSVVVSVTVSGCVHMTDMADGTTDTMIREDQQIRESLVVDQASPSRPLTYLGSPRCSFTYEYTTRGANTETYRYSVARRALNSDTVGFSFVHEAGQGEDMLVSGGGVQRSWPDMRSGEGTMLVGATGELRDFNIWAPAYARRVTGSNYTSDGRWSGRESERSRFVRRELTLLYPHIVDRSPQPGDTIAHIRDETGQVWARYVYRGLSNYRGERAVVFDLIRNHQARDRTQEVLVGFTIFSADRLVPMYQTMNSLRGPVRTRLVSCERS